MDRYRCIVVPPYRSKITTKQASIYSGMTWLLASAIFIPVPMWFRQQETEDGGLICTMVFPKSESINYAVCFVIPVLVITCILPMVVLVYNYHRIFKKILSTKNTWASSCVMVSSEKKDVRRQSEVSLSDIFAPWPRKSSKEMAINGRHGSLSHHEEIRLHKHIRVVRVLFLNVIVVLVMWLPITLVMLLIFIDGRRPTEDHDYFLRSYHFIASLVVAFLNTVVNPLLYGVLSDNFRSCLMRLCCNTADHPENTKIIRENATVTPSSGRNIAGSYKAAIKQSSINSVSENPNDAV